MTPTDSSSHALAVDPPEEEALRARWRVAKEKVELRIDPALLANTAQGETDFWSIVPHAERALQMALRLREPKFHLFLASCTDWRLEESLVSRLEKMKGTTQPCDIVYVHSFRHPEAPRPLLLPVGMGGELAQAMEQLVDDLCAGIPSILDAEEVKQAQKERAEQLEGREKAIFDELGLAAKTVGFGVRSVQGGVQTFPILHGKPVSAEQFSVLDESTKRALAIAEEKMAHEVEKAAKLVRTESMQLARSRSDVLRQAAERVIEEALRSRLLPLMETHPVLAEYIREVRQALIDDWEDWLEDEKQKDPSGRDRFRVNCFVLADPSSPSPVCSLAHPTYVELFGTLNRHARGSLLETDLMGIRPGAIHRTYGGFLVLSVSDLLSDPEVWKRLKKVLREEKLAPEERTSALSLAASLHPVAAPVAPRVVLIGAPEMYAALFSSDPDFASLFRIKIEIDPWVDSHPDNWGHIDAFWNALGEKRNWPVWNLEARARRLELAIELAQDRSKVTLPTLALEEVIVFACAQAEQRGGEVTVSDLDWAWNERRARLASAERHILEGMIRGEIALETTGKRVGVVNGLSVFGSSDAEFGQPIRITAVVAIGREGIIDVEREAQLGGAIHTKGIAILRGYLGHKFGQERPLSLRAQLAIEQSYGEVDGDSASSSELFAVLSALADVGIEQGIAVTGSVNQLGEMQAIGGVSAKIEGFYDLCAARGLTGTQGVLIPQANLQHLVLRREVADAIGEGRFHLYAVATVDEGIAVLTGIEGGERDQEGKFPAASIFGRVERRIIEMAEKLRDAEERQAMEEGEPGVEGEIAAEGGEEAFFGSHSSAGSRINRR